MLQSMLEVFNVAPKASVLDMIILLAANKRYGTTMPELEKLTSLPRYRLLYHMRKMRDMYGLIDVFYPESNAAAVILPSIIGRTLLLKLTGENPWQTKEIP